MQQRAQAPYQEWAQDSSALQFCKKSLDFNPVICDNQQHLQKEKNEKREKIKKLTLCKADYQLCLLIDYRLV